MEEVCTCIKFNLDYMITVEGVWETTFHQQTKPPTASKKLWPLFITTKIIPLLCTTLGWKHYKTFISQAEDMPLFWLEKG